MDKRTKMLVFAFGSALAYVIFSSAVYPAWIEPVLNIDQRIAARERDHDKLKALEDRVKRAVREYRAWVARTGSLDIGRVETDVRARLNRLIEKYQLDGASVSPGRRSVDRKTQLKKMQITVTAVGKLQSAVEFLKEVSELPHLVRVGNVALYPAGRGRTKAGPPRVNLRVLLELRVLPKQRLVGKIKEDELQQPEQFVRHADRDYSRIWVRKPFTEPIPLRANAGKDVRVVQHQQVRFHASASGGDGQYVYEWSPSVRLSSPKGQSPTIDTSKALNQTYTLVVRDGDGNTSTDTVHVTVTEPRKPKPVRVATTPKPKPPEPVDPQWKDAKYMQLRMTLLQEANGKRTDEVMVYDNKRHRAVYYAVGDPFDGGELLLVHPRGGIVHRKDEYFLYPVGEWLHLEVKADSPQAAEYPELKSAADRVRAAVEAEKKKQEEQARKQAAEVKKKLEAEPESDRQSVVKAVTPKPPNTKPKPKNPRKSSSKLRDLRSRLKKARGKMKRPVGEQGKRKPAGGKMIVPAGGEHSSEKGKPPAKTKGGKSKPEGKKGS